MGTRHLLGLQGVDAGQIRAWVRLSESMRAGARPTLQGKTIANLFFEDSTRTRTSFAIAAGNLGARVVDLTGSGSSVSKGESLIDTARTVEAMGVAALVVRARQSGAAELISRHVRVAVINAGDGRHEHPTQGLLDIATLARASGRGESLDFSGFTLAIVGDVVSSRVARSAIAGFVALGARVVCVGPTAMAPRALGSLGAEVSHDLDAVLGEADGVMMLRIQFERHGEGTRPEDKKTPIVSSIRDYREMYGLTRERAGRLKPGAWVLHPGPMNRGIEIDDEVADSPRSLIVRQVESGVFVRMGVLDWAVNG